MKPIKPKVNPTDSMRFSQFKTNILGNLAGTITSLVLSKITLEKTSEYIAF
jgi:hypothetical protein